MNTLIEYTMGFVLGCPLCAERTGTHESVVQADSPGKSDASPHTPVGTAVCTRKYSPSKMRGRTGYFTGTGRDGTEIDPGIFIYLVSKNTKISSKLRFTHSFSYPST